MLKSPECETVSVDLRRRTASRVDEWLLLLVGALVASGMFVYPPGSDVSAFAFSQSAISAPIRIFGQTALAWCSLMLLIIAGCVGLGRQGRLPRGLWLALVVAVIYLGARSLFAVAAGGADLDLAARQALPLLLFAALATSECSQATFERFFVLVNVGLLGQAVVCKILTGSFGANKYYIELPEEFFGYYYSPFAFSGALAVLSVYAMSRVLAGRRVAWWLLLLGCNLWFIWSTQVRTFLVAAALGMVVLAARHAFVRGRTLIFAGLIFAGVALLAVWTPEMLSRGRLVSDLSSGRLERWASDIEGLMSIGSDLDIFVGMGPGSIYELNAQLFGVRINSLNLAVDTLVDFGVFGAALLAVAWFHVLKFARVSSGMGMAAALAVFFVASSMLTSMIDFPVVTSLFVVMACSRLEAPRVPSVLVDGPLR